MQESQRTVIVCPLDWGLGHATRMVPVIDGLIKSGAKVIIAADNRPLAFLKQRFPKCTFEQFPGYSPRYPTHGFLMPFVMMASYPVMMKKAHKAQVLLKQIVKKHQADIVISDNRYECYIKNVYSIFITHQLHIQTFGWHRIFKMFIQRSIKKYLNHYQEIWIPDFEGNSNLSGVLSHPILKINPKQTYIGLLSRFSLMNVTTEPTENDLVIILSGPEPQRTLLEDSLTKQARDINLTTLIIQGKPEIQEDFQDGNLRKISHANDQLMAEYIKGAGLVVCRPGYSTLMDLAVLQKKAAFIPTPGQTEQVYLAQKLTLEMCAYSHTQKNFNLLKAYESRDQYTGLPLFNQDEVLKQCLQRILILDLNNKLLSN